MAKYSIHARSSVEKDLRLITKKDQIKILKRIDALALNPRPPGCKKLTGENKYRIRQGDYRIIYTIHDKELIVWVVKVGHRKDIYRVSEEKEKYKSGNRKNLKAIKKV
jgi:mRNA interferase RelE/StbE